MSRNQEHASPQNPSVKTDDASSPQTGSIGHPIESFVMAVTTAQAAYFEAVSQCALAWIKVSTGQLVAPSRTDHAVPSRTIAKSGPVQSGQHALVKSVDWLSVPVITGIEETFNDHLTKPRRPVKPQDTDVLTLWKRSNEFGENDAQGATRPRPDDGHREVA